MYAIKSIRRFNTKTEAEEYLKTHIKCDGMNLDFEIIKFNKVEEMTEADINERIQYLEQKKEDLYGNRKT